jgi:hypothetical protein
MTYCDPRFDLRSRCSATRTPFGTSTIASIQPLLHQRIYGRIHRALSSETPCRSIASVAPVDRRPSPQRFMRPTPWTSATVHVCRIISCLTLQALAFFFSLMVALLKAARIVLGAAWLTNESHVILWVNDGIRRSFSCISLAAAILVKIALWFFSEVSFGAGVPDQRLRTHKLFAFLIYLSFIQRAMCANVSVYVDPLNGRDWSQCDVTQPCQTIAYSIHARRASYITLSPGVFNESSIVVNRSVSYLNVYGSGDKSSVLDCGRRQSLDFGPAFLVSDAFLSISGITFQNCVNFDTLNGTGGAVSAYSSTITVSNCAFFNNVAQTGGAIGALFGSLTVTRSLFENNTATCRVASAVCAAWGGAAATVESALVRFIGNNFIQNYVRLDIIKRRDNTCSAEGGGGCVSVLFASDVFESRVFVDANSFHGCSVQIFGPGRTQNGSAGAQYGNAFGGAVSLYYGLHSESFLQVSNASSVFTNNSFLGCDVTGSEGIGGNVYGGCLSVYAGSNNRDISGTISGSVSVDIFSVNLTSNNFINCSSSMSALDRADGENSFGGGISLVVGTFSYSRAFGNFTSHVTINNSIYAVSNNAFTLCTASSVISSSTSDSSASITSNGANAYGGGILVSVGAFSFSQGVNLFSGDTTVTSSTFTLYGNMLAQCSASITQGSVFPSASIRSKGAAAHGGGISISVGAYSYGNDVNYVRSDTIVKNSTYIVSNNSLINCSSLSTTSSSSTSSSTSTSFGVTAYGGGISVAVGAFSFGGGDGNNYDGDTVVASSSYIISSNMLNGCSAASITSSSSSGLATSIANGARSHGGGISVVVGAFTFGSSTNVCRGDTTVNNSTYTVSSNTLRNCTVSSTTSSASLFSDSSSASYGVNAYGGGISFATTVFSGNIANNFNGFTRLIGSAYTISDNALTNCSSASSTESLSTNDYRSDPVTSASSNGSSVFGGGISVAVSADSYGSVSNLHRGNTIVNNSNFTVSRNALSYCTISSTTSTSSLQLVANSFSNGIGAYGGGISVLGAFIYGGVGDLNEIEGDISVIGSSYSISSNVLTNCSAFSTTTSSSTGEFFTTSISSGGNAFGGCISIAMGAFSCSTGISQFTGLTSVRNSSFVVSRNTLTLCSAASATVSRAIILGSALSVVEGAGAFGGGILVAVGAYTCGGRNDLRGDTLILNSIFVVSNNLLDKCFADASTTSSTISKLAKSAASTSSGVHAYGGGISIAVGAYAHGSAWNLVFSDTIVSSSSFALSGNALNNCIASSTTSSSSLLLTSSNSNGANAYGGGMYVAMGSYSYGSRSNYVKGVTKVDGSSYDVSSNTFANCSALSVTSSSNPSPFTSLSNGANVYGGCFSAMLGAYSYSVNSNDFTGSTTFGNSSSMKIENSSFFSCKISSFSRSSSEALSFGGAVSIIFDSYSYSQQESIPPSSVSLGSVLQIAHCNFSQCNSLSYSSSCSPRATNAAGGAVLLSVFDVEVRLVSSFFFDSSVKSDCAASSSETYSVGGGLSVLRAKSVIIANAYVMRCVARGIWQATNIMVSGGGIFIQNVTSVTILNSLISECGVENALTAGVAVCGGGALCTTHVAAVQISNSRVFNNFDSCLSGVIFLQQLSMGSDLFVGIDHSVLTTDPSISVALPVLNISCGLKCPIEQQKRLRLNVTQSTMAAQNQAQQFYESAVVMSFPMSLHFSANKSFLNCSFTDNNNTALLLFRSADNGSISVTCASCIRPFSVAISSRSMLLSQFSNFENQIASGDSCHPLNLASLDSSSITEQKCPFGFSVCSTVALITVGFWANVSSRGSIGKATRCPPNYCGCRNIPGFAQPTCQFFPYFAVEFEPEEALCSGNRTGVLCGGCKTNFTQSLNGYSCIPNEVCQQNFDWLWAVTVLGYVLYSIYILRQSLKTQSDGFIMCLLFYGQISSFAAIPPILKSNSLNSAEATWFSRVIQFESVVSLYESTCIGLDMGAYDATLAQLSGPAIVLSVTFVLTLVAGRLQLRFTNYFQKHNLDIRKSYGVVMINVLQLLFSSVTVVVFRLITCVDVGDSVAVDRIRVFVDGTRKCSGNQHSLLYMAAVFLSVLLVLFCAALKFNRISGHTRAVVCSPYPENRYYWIAVQLIFRFAITVVSATVFEVPSLAAMAMCICSIFMLAVLIAFRPYVDKRTHYFDVFCHIVLIAQFSLQSVARVSESVGFSIPEGSRFYEFVNTAADASLVLRFASSNIMQVIHLTISYSGTYLS